MCKVSAGPWRAGKTTLATCHWTPNEFVALQTEIVSALLRLPEIFCSRKGVLRRSFPQRHRVGLTSLVDWKIFAFAWRCILWGRWPRIFRNSEFWEFPELDSISNGHKKEKEELNSRRKRTVPLSRFNSHIQNFDFFPFQRLFSFSKCSFSWPVKFHTTAPWNFTAKFHWNAEVTVAKKRFQWLRLVKLRGKKPTKY